MLGHTWCSVMLQSAGICGKVPSFVLLHSVTHPSEHASESKIAFKVQHRKHHRFCSRKKNCYLLLPLLPRTLPPLPLTLTLFFSLSHHWKRSPLMSSDTGTAAQNKRPAGPLLSHIIGPQPGNHTISPNILLACHKKRNKKKQFLLRWELLKLVVILYFLIFHLIKMFCFGSIFSWGLNFWKIVALVCSLLCRNVSL